MSVPGLVCTCSVQPTKVVDYIPIRDPCEEECEDKNSSQVYFLTLQI